jgi:SAM-dependent methyltransferase
MDDPSGPYYRRDLALVHHRGFASHSAACAPGILELLTSVRQRDGLVVEIGCGSGLLTKDLIRAGHRVVGTDASPAMLALAREMLGRAAEIRRLVLPDDPLPAADAIVGVGHALNYLPNAAAVDRALVRIAEALLPGGLLAIDLCDLEWGRARRNADALGRIGDDWAIITRFLTPFVDQFVREITTFVRNDDGSWRRDDERHNNVLIDTSKVPALLARHGVEAEVRDSFGGEDLPTGLRAIVGSRASSSG